MKTESQKLKIKKNTVLCRANDKTYDLYIVLSGKLLICSRSGHMVTPIAHLSENQYFGEMSFIDKRPRSADVIALEDTELLKIPNDIIKNNFPKWLLIMAKSMTQKLRLLDDVIKDKGIKRQNVQSIKPLSIDEQRYYFELLSK